MSTQIEAPWSQYPAALCGWLLFYLQDANQTRHVVSCAFAVLAILLILAHLPCGNTPKDGATRAIDHAICTSE
jgi:hypothetical protein